MFFKKKKTESTPVDPNYKKVSKKSLRHSFLQWYYGSLTGFSQEHMQTFGYLCAMLPVIEDLYQPGQQQQEALSTYTAFFNTEPQVGAIIVGMSVGLEEAKANNEPIDGEMINAIRAGLMGPMAGIGDSLVVGTLIPILLAISLGMSQGGSPLGAIFYIIVWNLLAYFGMRWLYYTGYRLGGKAVDIIVGEQANAIRDAVIMMGTIVIGGVAATWININTSLKILNSTGGTVLDLKTTLDGIFPKLLTFGTVMFCWYLMRKKKLSPLWVMLLLLGIALVGVLVGFFDPGISSY